MKTHLIYQGTALLLRSSSVLSNRTALVLAAAIDIMDVYMDDFLLPVSDKRFTKNTDLLQGCELSLFFFYKYRIGCTCLDEKCASSAVQKSTGLCAHCNIRKECSQLLVCSGCNRVQYYSKECQVAHWSCHEEDCKKSKIKLASLGGKGKNNVKEKNTNLKGHSRK